MLSDMRTIVGVLLAASLTPLSVYPGQGSAPKPEAKYEMDNYVVGFLRKGPKWSAEDTAERARIQEGHMAHIRSMGETGKLVVAGPFSDEGDLRGMFIFGVSSVEEARKMAEGDPAVQSGRLVLELHPWFAGKGLSVAKPH
jgi:uncharacterized protein YciI